MQILKITSIAQNVIYDMLLDPFLLFLLDANNRIINSFLLLIFNEPVWLYLECTL